MLRRDVHGQRPFDEEVNRWIRLALGDDNVTGVELKRLAASEPLLHQCRVDVLEELRLELDDFG